MAEVPAVSVSKDTAETPVASQIKPEQTGFDALLEDEKKKIVASPIPSFNLQSLFNVPLNVSTGINVDNAAASYAAHTSLDPKMRETADQARPERSDTDYKSEKESRTRSDTVQNDQKVQQNKAADQAMQNISRALISDFEITPQFFDAMSAASEGSEAIGTLDMNDLISQIKDKIKFIQDNGKIELSMALKPDGLGSILLSITSNKGIISINIYADALAKRTLDDRLPELEKALKLANLAIGDLKVLPDGRHKNNAQDYLSDLLYNEKQEKEG